MSKTKTERSESSTHTYVRAHTNAHTRVRAHTHVCIFKVTLTVLIYLHCKKMLPADLVVVFMTLTPSCDDVLSNST